MQYCLVKLSFAFMGFPIYRFRFNCTKCSAPLSIKADHVNLDRLVESGATTMSEEEERQVKICLV